MKNKEKIIYVFFVAIILILSLGPILWCLIISLTPESDMLVPSNHILPGHLIIDNYLSLFDPQTSEHQTLMVGLTSSLKLSALTLLIGVPVSTITGYALARFRFRLKGLYANIILLTTVIPAFATLIPIYSIFRNYDMLDSMFWAAVILVSAFMPLNTWIVMNYTKSLPEELWLQSSIDGLNDWQTFWYIILPLLKPIVFTISLLIFIMSWQQYIIPVILLSSYDNKVMTVIMSEFTTRDTIQYGIIARCGIIATIPPAVLAVLFRKSLVSGITQGASKF